MVSTPLCARTQEITELEFLHLACTRFIAPPNRSRNRRQEFEDASRAIAETAASPGGIVVADAQLHFQQ